MLSRTNMLDCIKLAIFNLKTKIDKKEILHSEVVPTIEMVDNLDFSSKKKDSNVPWPKIEGNLPIQNPNSISPRIDTDRTGTDTNFQFTRRTNHTNHRGFNSDLKIIASKNNQRNFKLPQIKNLSSENSSIKMIPNSLTKRTRAEGLIERPPETIILKIPEL